MRQAKVERQTKETSITCFLQLDRMGESSVETGVGFFDHMLALWAFHASLTLQLKAVGDLEVDAHHTVEDVGIVLGQAVRQALGDCHGIQRYGTAYVPMDETLSRVSLDISGRPYCGFHAAFSKEKVGSFDTELVEEFFRAFTLHSGITLHIDLIHGSNTHHQIESIFKAFGRALKEAVTVVGKELPSTKGVLL
jgi:imidazoleglycerol-phosphate dehydratase